MEKFLRSNIFVQLIAVFMAVILWLFVTGDKITRTTPQREIHRDVPLAVENLSPDYIVIDMPASVDVTLEGLPDDFAELTLQEIEAFVDLSGKGSGNHLVRVEGRPPRGLDLVMLEPEQVRVSLEAYLSEDFEIEVNLIGEPADGWELVEYSVIPETVLVGAPETIFERVDRLVLVIDISGMRLIESVELTPIAYDEEGNRVNNLVMDPSLITVRFEFERVTNAQEENDVN